MNRVVVEVGKTLAKAVLAGVGVELARVAAEHLRRHLGPKKPSGAPAQAEATPEAIRDEVQKLRDELARLRAELATRDVL